MVPKDTSITIIGAGIGGLTCAISLQNLGYQIKVFERADQLTEIGAGLTIPPNARKAIQYLGFEKQVIAASYKPAKAAIKDYYSGETLKEIDINPSGNNRVQEKDNYSPIYGTLQIHRADFQSILLKEVLKNDPNSIFLNHEFTNFSINNGSLVCHFKDNKSYNTDALIACDGNKSLVRESINGNDKLNYLGYVAWRGLISSSDIPSDLIQPDTATFIGKNKIFARYKIRSGKIINYVGFSKKNDWQNESWTVRSSINELLSEFSDSTDEIVSLIKKTQTNQCFKWALAGREPIKKWSVNNITLLGDAAHPMLPFLGQGAAMAIEDSVILSRLFLNEDNIKDAFKKYEQNRINRTTMVMHGAELNGLKLSGSDYTNFIKDKNIYTEEEVAEYNPVEAAL